MFWFKNKTNKKTGLTLVEALVGTAIFAVLAVSVYQAFVATMDAVRLSRIKITATALANEQFEIMRNLKYADVGIIGGLPLGKIPSDQTLVRDNKEFAVHTTIRNIDDPFDGSIGQNPNDTSPADYKLAELKITCAKCDNFSPLILTTYIGPKALESASTNGAIFVKVFNSSGQPVPEANVHIENNLSIPPFLIEDTTKNDGILQVIDAPPGAQAYEINVTKDGYTSEQTYTIGDPANPNPIKPHANVLTQQLTEVSFFIDKVSSLNVESVNEVCAGIPNIDFSLTGSKLIGTSPDILKYSEDHSTDADGIQEITDLEWDDYNLDFTDDTYDLAGTIPATSFTLSPDSIQNIKFIVSPKNPKSLLVTVKDAATGLPISDAEVNLTGEDFDTTLMTGRGFIRQTDWSGGAGQVNYVDSTKYFDSDSNLDISNPSGEIKLKQTFGEYAPSAWLVSSTFDTGSASNFHQILWQPQSQPAESGPDSVRLQIATNNDKATWNFIGPDGTESSYYTLSNQDISSEHNGKRYLRYKVFLQTADVTKTPDISDISFTFTSDCVPPGQVFFSGLLNNNYTLSVSKSDYQSDTSSQDILANWQQTTIILNP